MGGISNSSENISSGNPASPDYIRHQTRSLGTGLANRLGSGSRYQVSSVQVYMGLSVKMMAVGCLLLHGD